MLINDYAFWGPFRCPGDYWLCVRGDEKATAVFRVLPEDVEKLPKEWIVIRPETAEAIASTFRMKKFPVGLFPIDMKFFDGNGLLELQFWTLPRWRDLTAIGADE